MGQVAENSRVESLLTPFVRTMQSAGLLADLDPQELAKVPVDTPTTATGRLAVLARYYGVGAGSRKGLQRRKADRFFMYRASHPVGACSVVNAISHLCPELDGLELTSLGDGERLLRTVNQFAPIEANAPDVALERIFACVNSLLARNTISERFVRLEGDEEREAYVATSVSNAMELCNANLLEHDKPEDVMSLGQW